MDIKDPLATPNLLMAVLAYSEHVGENLHEGPIIGLKKTWYKTMVLTKMNFIFFLKTFFPEQAKIYVLIPQGFVFFHYYNKI